MTQIVLVVAPSNSAFGMLCEDGLTAARTALERDDDESLHDLRVALRRLHVLVEQLARPDAARKKLMREIRVVLKQSNRARDTQVMLAWLQEVWPRLEETERIAARHWQRRLERLQKRCRLEPQRSALLLNRVARILTRLSPPAGMASLPLGMLVAQRLEQQSGELLALLQGRGAAERFHLIRLKAKTLRYLLLPFALSLPACADAEAALRQMQTVMGDWHDGVVRQRTLLKQLRNEVDRIGSDRELASLRQQVAERSPAMPGLLALSRINNAALRRQVARIVRHYLRAGAERLALQLLNAAAEMRKAATAQGRSVTIPPTSTSLPKD